MCGKLLIRSMDPSGGWKRNRLWGDCLNACKA
jgi:hypothetical protein